VNRSAYYICFVSETSDYSNHAAHGKDMQLPSASVVWANDLAHQAVRVVGREVSSSARKNMLLKHYDFKHDRHAN